jgi:hypothetical protein
MWQEFASGQINALTDDSYETLWKNPSNTGPATTIEEGDIIVGVFDIVRISAPVTKNWAVDWTSEFTGVFQLTVVDKTDAPTGTITIGPVGQEVVYNQYGFTFGPATVNVLSIPNWTIGKDMVATFSDAANNFATPYPVASAIGGLEAWHFGYVNGTPANGEGWTTNAVDTLVPYLSATTPSLKELGEFQVALNRTFTPDYLAYIEFGKLSSVVDGTANSVEMNGVGQLFKSPAVGWPIKDNLDLEIAPTIVPEPLSMLVWSGLGLTFAFGVRRKRRS